MNINPLYLQEVSREYYTKILNNSPQQKAATRLTKKWLAKHPNASREDIIKKFGDFSYKVHFRYDKARKRQLDNSLARIDHMYQLSAINRDDPENRFKLKYTGWTKDDSFKDFRNNTKTMRNYRKNKITNDIFEL